MTMFFFGFLAAAVIDLLTVLVLRKQFVNALRRLP